MPGSAIRVIDGDPASRSYIAAIFEEEGIASLHAARWDATEQGTNDDRKGRADPE